MIDTQTGLEVSDTNGSHPDLVLEQIRQIQRKLREHTIGSPDKADRVNHPVWEAGT